MTESSKSKTPFFTFSNTLEEQRNELENNELIKRFAVSREELSSDKYRPLYHFVSPESTLNDPNGLCFWQDKWHLFYQGFPVENEGNFHPVHWGHTISDDLIHWGDLPYAIYPDPEQSCFSGATLVEDDRVVAMYHGVGRGNFVALSRDPLLLNWEKLTGDAVIKPEEFISCPRVFDPCIWKGIDYYYCLSGGVEANKHGKHEHRADFLFRSKDLVHWEFLHNFIDGDLFGHVGDDGACPYFWPIGGDKHILLHYSHMSGGAYMIGYCNRSTDKFCVVNGGDFCFGATGLGSVHAPSACPAPDGSGDVICIFNMNSAKPTPPWNQIMSLPRRLSLYDQDRLAQVPAGDIESLRGEKSSVAPISLEANKEITLENINGDCMEMEVEIDPMDTNYIEVKVLRSPDSEEFTRVTFYRNRGYRSTLHRESPAKCDSIISLDNSHSSIASDVRARLPENGGFDLPEGEILKLRVFIDRSIVEVFANDRQCVALRVYPERDDSTGVSIMAKGREAKLLKLNVWQMKSIYV